MQPEVNESVLLSEEELEGVVAEWESSCTQQTAHVDMTSVLPLQFIPRFLSSFYKFIQNVI